MFNYLIRSSEADIGKYPFLSLAKTADSTTQFHTSTTIVRFAAYYGNSQPQFRAAWNVIEKFQMTGFMLQEFIISGIYLYETTKLLRIMKKNNTRRTVAKLLVVILQMLRRHQRLTRPTPAVRRSNGISPEIILVD